MFSPPSTISWESTFAKNSTIVAGARSAFWTQGSPSPSCSLEASYRIAGRATQALRIPLVPILRDARDQLQETGVVHWLDHVSIESGRGGPAAIFILTESGHCH
jgi:hypothetical protein